MTNSTPDAWRAVEPEYGFQPNAWQHEVTGQVLVMEAKREPWHDDDEGPDLSLKLLSAEQQDNPEPISTIIEQRKDPDEVLAAAREYMRTNDPQP